MRNRQDARGTLRRGLPALASVFAVLGLALCSTALAEDPIVGIGPLGAGGTTASASAHDDPAASLCIGDDQLDLGLSGSSLVVPTEAVCAASAGGTTSVTNSTNSTNTSNSTNSSSASSSSGGSTAAGAVSAADAVGLRIVRVRTNLNRVRATKRFRLFVTLKDRRGLLVRGATVSVGRVPGRTATAAGVRVVKTNKAGTALVAVRVKRSQFGKRLFVRIAARTPNARAVAPRSVRLPKLG
jgi:hypothetical protein